MNEENLKKELEAQIIKNEDMEADLRQVKEVAFKMLDIFGMVNPDGTINENIKIKSVVAKVSGIIQRTMFGNTEGLAKEFSFLSEIKPIYEKYKDL